MKVVEHKEYIIQLPGGNELRLNEEAWNAVQHLTKEASLDGRRNALLEAAGLCNRFALRGMSAAECAGAIERVAKGMK